MSLSAELYAPDDADRAWLENLSRTAPGRALKEHFLCVDHALRNKNRAECPIQQVADFRRILCAGLAESDRSFGLPRPLPKYLAVVNMSGFRALLYSSRSALVRLLCLVGPESSQKTVANVEAVLQHAVAKNTSVMVCLSMPWQAGVCAAHWEVRTLERDQDGTIRDGSLCYSFTHETVRCVACSVEADVTRKDVMRAQIAAFTKHFSACNLDVAAGEGAPSDASDDRMAKLSSIVSGVRADRERLLGELSALKDDHAKAISEAERTSDERVGKVAAAAMQAETACRNRTLEIEKHSQTLLEQNMALAKAKAEAERKLAEHELFQEQVLNKEKSKASMQELSAKSAADKLATFQKNSAREREQTENAHARIVSDLERRVSTEQMNVRKAQAHLEAMQLAQHRLGEVCDQLRTEKQALSYDSISMRKKIIGLRCAIAVAAHKHSTQAQAMRAGQHELQQMLAQAEGAAHASELQVEILAKELSDSKAEKKSAKKKATPVPKTFLPQEQETTASASASAVATKPDTPTRQWAADPGSKCPDGPPPSSWVAERETVEIEVQTGGQTAAEQKLSHDFGELSTEFAKLSDEMERVTKERDDMAEQLANVSDTVDTCVVTMQTAPSPAAPSPPPNDVDVVSANTHGNVQQRVYNQVYNQVVVPGHGYMHVPPHPHVDLGSDPSGDIGLETLIGQAQTTMRTLVDMARQGSQHKHAADNMWSELQALKRFTGAEIGMPCGWQQQPGYCEVPHHPQQHWSPPMMPGRNGQTGRRGTGVGR